MSEKKLVFDPNRLFTYLSRHQVYPGQLGIVGDTITSILSDIQRGDTSNVFIIAEVLDEETHPFRARRAPEGQPSNVGTSDWEFFYLLTSEELVDFNPEPEYVPYTWENASNLMGKWYMSDGENGEQYVQQIVTLIKDGDEFRINGRSAQDMLNECRWMDGSPCGVHV